VQLRHGCRFPFGLLAIGLKLDLLTRQGAFDENDFALATVFVRHMADATPIHVEGFDINDILLHRNNRGDHRRGRNNQTAIVNDCGIRGKLKQRVFTDATGNQAALELDQCLLLHLAHTLTGDTHFDGQLLQR